MKKLFLVMYLVAIDANAKELKNFNEVKSAVIDGKQIHIVVDFSTCQNDSKDLSPVVGVFTPNSVIATNSYMTASFNHFTLNSPGLVNTPVNEYIVYRFTIDNHVLLTVNRLNPLTYAEFAPAQHITCAMSESVKVYT